MKWPYQVTEKEGRDGILEKAKEAERKSSGGTGWRGQAERVWEPVFRGDEAVVDAGPGGRDGAGRGGQAEGASSGTIDAWWKLYQEGGPEGLMRQGTHPSTRKVCEELESRIEQFRRDHPEEGVRRIRDALKREEGVGVSAETVRRVVNDAGLGNPPIANLVVHTSSTATERRSGSLEDHGTRRVENPR
jgi:Homeodomain-like domain